MYNKLFTKILDSSIWLEDDATRIVWFTFLAAMDQDGFAQFASVKNLAHRARVSLDACEKALGVLEGPDSDSADPDHEGRRIERVDGGWMILNAAKYRDLVTREVARARTRERVAKHRAMKRRCNGGVTQSEANAGSEAEHWTKGTPPAEVFQEYIEEFCPHIRDKRGDLYDKLTDEGWIDANGEKIRNWRGYVDALEIIIETETKREREGGGTF